MLRILHRVDDRAVAAGGLSEATAVLARGEGAELAIDEGNDLLRQVVGVRADRRRVHVLVAAERGEAIGKHENRGSHLLLVNQSRGAFGYVVAKGFPIRVSKPGTGE